MMPRMKRPTPCSCALAVGLLVASLQVVACDLPQNASADSGADTAEDAPEPDTEPRSWRLLKLIDRSQIDETEMPGLDLDAIVVSLDGTFISAGCKGVPVVYESDTQGSSEVNAHSDPSLATLHAVDGESASGGFVSLASGVFTCELPVPVWTGSTISIFEVEGDGDEAWDARLAPDATGEYEDAALDMNGSSDFVVP